MTHSLFTDQKGQALVEFAMFLPIYLLLAFGLIFFAKAYFVQQQVVSASRFAAWEKGYRKSTDEELKTKVKNYFFGRLDKERVQVTEVSSAQAMDMYNTGTSRSGSGGDSGGMASGLMGLMDTLSSSKGYAVSYSMTVSPFLKSTLGDKTNIASACVVDANAWSYKELGDKSFWGVIAAKIGGIFSGS
ncbi:MAG: pilus assembly protein [Holophagae bacterium]|nr:pilus assembly protein [Holophagae bacterium]